jgi:methylated-DNA-[protein]-cysteine S-methyltransferase
MGFELMHERIHTPFGPLGIYLSPRGVCRIAFGEGDVRTPDLGHRFDGVTVVPRNVPSQTALALARYFGGDLRALCDLPVDVIGTPFQLDVWKILRTIGPGHTLSYGQVARMVGRPKGFRAVGMANHSNPVPLVIPCHRVIAADGTLGGYGGGVDKKVWLLRHEAYLLT